jgi:(p)ppGpp synthase/HD superfamily hydrolase
LKKNDPLLFENLKNKTEGETEKAESEKSKKGGAKGASASAKGTALKGTSVAGEEEGTDGEPEIEKYKGKTFREKKAREDVLISGADKDILIRLGRCCSPIPGDEIIGHITKGRGITVHKTDCKNVLALSDEEKKRLTPASWNALYREDSYEVHFSVYSAYRRGIIADISRVALDLDVEIITMNMNKAKNDHFSIDLTMKIIDLAMLDRFTARIKQIVGVLEIRRIES